MTSEHQTETQEHPDAWAYDAVNEKPPAVEGSPASPGTSPNANGTVGQSDPSGTPGGEDNQTSQDPLANLSLQELLKHPVLGPQLDSWNDRTSNSKVAAARERLTSELTPQIRANVEYEETKAYLNGLSPDERGTVLARDP
jgi:hypothetical protein